MRATYKTENIFIVILIFILFRRLKASIISTLLHLWYQNLFVKFIFVYYLNVMMPVFFIIWIFCALSYRRVRSIASRCIYRWLILSAVSFLLFYYLFESLSIFFYLFSAKNIPVRFFVFLLNNLIVRFIITFNAIILSIASFFWWSLFIFWTLKHILIKCIVHKTFIILWK